jgi:hypothetical protein
MPDLYIISGSNGAGSTTTPSLLAKMINKKLELSTTKDKLPNWFIKFLPEILNYQ